MPHVPNPTIVEREGHIERSWDVYSRLFRDRIIYLGTPINDDVANLMVAQLLYLNSEDPDRDISLYINSPGGEVVAGLVIYDVMQHIKPDISTVCLNASSMASVLLAAGARGKRFILPNGEVMIHQGSAGFQGATPDLAIHMEHTLRLMNRLTDLLAHHTGQTVEQVRSDSGRDYFMDAQQALDYGIVDQILDPAKLLMPAGAQTNGRWSGKVPDA